MNIDIRQMPPSAELIEIQRTQLLQQRKRIKNFTLLQIVAVLMILGWVLTTLNDQRLIAYTGILIVAALISALIGALGEASKAQTFSMVGIFTVSCVAAGIGMSANGAGAGPSSIIYAIGISILTFLIAAYWTVVVQKKIADIRVQLLELQPLDRESPIMQDIVTACKNNEACYLYHKAVVHQFRPLTVLEAKTLAAWPEISEP